MDNEDEDYNLELGATGSDLSTLSESQCMFQEAFPSLLHRMKITTFVKARASTKSPCSSPSRLSSGRLSSGVPPGSPSSRVPVGSPSSWVPAGSPTSGVPAGSPSSRVPRNPPYSHVPSVSPSSRVPAGSPSSRVPAGLRRLASIQLGFKVEDVIMSTPKGREIHEDMMKTKTWTKKQRCFLMKQIGKKLFELTNNKPSADTKELVAKELIVVFPFLKLPARSDGSGTTDAVYDRTNFKGPLETFCRGKRHRDKEISTQPRKKRRISNVDGNDSNVEAIEKMRQEYPSTDPIRKEHLKLMEETFEDRRNYIEKERPSVVSVTKRYPRLFDTPLALKEEFSRIYPTAKPLPDFLKKYRAKLLALAKEETKLEEAVEYLTLQEQTQEALDINMLRALCVFFLPARKKTIGEIKQFFNFFEHETVDAALETTVKAFTVQGGIIRVGITYYVVLDKIAFRVEEGSFFEALEHYVKAVHVFNVEYPKFLKNIFGLFERAMGLNDTVKVGQVVQFFQKLVAD
ncbi:unnamed protein product [Cyprideis torosa]|uniref:Uncharacterized protein n=1 Tax=Cyprideis torosa TaxID=163714 RepID=A0A7R8ZRQ8_9CRUS|nr:unnamed protein product [Cyprideis torosa]CAG0893759.1 unnamed protein product [Cyprideis torosa]